MPGLVEAVCQASTHRFRKRPSMWIRLLAGLGADGDAHRGTTVKHRSRVARDPTQPNLRQVHLLRREILEELQARGFVIGPDQIGENILAREVNLLDRPTAPNHDAGFRGSRPNHVSSDSSGLERTSVRRMEIARLASASWLRIPDWQVLAMRAALLSPDDSRRGPGNAPRIAPPCLPPLDWPPALFQDEQSSH